MKLRALLAGAVFALAGTMTVPGTARADEILFKNGDRVTGKITSLRDGKMVVTTPEAGDIKVDTTQIESFSTDDPIQVRLSDGTLMSRRAALAEAGKVKLLGGVVGEESVGVGDIDAINPPSATWLGDIKFGGLLLRGNTSTESVNFGVDLARKTEKDIWTFGASYMYGKSKDHTTGVETTTADNWQADLKYEYNFTKKFYGFAEGLVSRDRLAFLDLRFNPAAGVGYRWFTKPIFAFATEGGLAWVYENYTNNTPTRQDISLKLAYHLTSKFNDHVAVFHDLSYYPSLESASNFIANLDAGIRATLTKHFFTEFKFVLNYDATPANGALKTNTRYELNVGYSL